MGVRKSLDQFVKEAKKVHGDKYKYSLVEYKNNYTKVKIVCSVHGVFEACPRDHLTNKGCPECKKQATILQNGKDFLEKANKLHNEKYDYSKVEYSKSQVHVVIICPDHGEFKQRPNAHLAGKGCRKCAGNHPHTSESFIEAAKIAHGDSYDYSEVSYTNAHGKVTIICPEHGEFEQQPSNHLFGKGCPVCANNIRHTSDQFILEARKAHGDKYDYSKVVYSNSNSPVIIICPKHGNFEQLPNLHKTGAGCPACALEKNANIKKQKHAAVFEDKAKDVHGEKYDYSKSDYEKANKKVTIICPKHGEFRQTPNSHLNGQGCPKCSESRGEMTIRRFFESEDINYIYQKRFDECKSKKPLPFDFYVPDYNLLIEYQGIQHFEVCRYSRFGGKKALDKRRQHDIVKKNWAKSNGFNFLEITYCDNVVEVLSTCVEKLKCQ